MAGLLPGVVLAAFIMVTALWLAEWLGSGLLVLQGIQPAGASSPVSGVLVAILLGMIIRNTVTLPAVFTPGIQFSVKSLLRLGIIFVGIKLSLVEIMILGVWGLPIVVVSIGAGLMLVTWVNRLLNLPPRLGTLIAAGTGICGVTAIVSVAPAIKADEKEVAYAVANITLFGLVGMFLYPYLAPLLFHSSEQVGLFLGIAVHETAQVIGAALTYQQVFNDDVAFQVATVTKLTRNLFLAVVVPLLALQYLRRDQAAGRALGQPQDTRTGDNGHVNITGLLPLFVLGFVLMAVLRTVGDATLADGAALGFLGAGAWDTLVSQIGDVWGSKYLLGTAMAGVGLGTSLSVFRGVGLKPFLVGLLGALLVGAIGLVMVLALGSFVHL